MVLISKIFTFSLVTLCCPWGSDGLQLVITSARLPTPLYHLSAVHDPVQDAIYLIGGGGSISYYNPKVWKYSVPFGTVQEVGTFWGTDRGTAFLDGSDILYLGGYNPAAGGAYDRNIYRYSTVADSYQAVATLPEGLTRARYAWDTSSRLVYFFGGWIGSQPTDHVYKLIVATDTVEPLAVKLPGAKYEMGVAWRTLEGAAYLFGGNVLGDNGRNVMRFDPAVNVTRLDTLMATGFTYPLCTGFLDSGERWAYIVAAQGMQRFNVETHEAEDLPVDNWPRSLSSFACAIVPHLKRLYIFGGYGFYEGGLGRYHDEISYVDL